MTVDRYTKLILTVIALELGWIAINGAGVPVLAQRSEATPVIIRGVEGPPGKQPLIPVTIMGSTILRVESERPRRQTNTINFGNNLPLAQGIKFDI